MIAMIRLTPEAARRLAVYRTLRQPAYLGELLCWVAGLLGRRLVAALKRREEPDFLALSLSFPGWILQLGGEALKRPARRAHARLMELADEE